MTAAAAESRPYMPHKPGTEDWCTPAEVVQLVRRVLGRIDLDPAGNPWSVVRPRREVWLPKWADELAARGEQVPTRVTVGDGLRDVPWEGGIFTNPPYGRDLDGFMDRARRAGREGADVVMLAPCKTSRACWQRTVPDAAAVCFIDGRLEFLVEGETKSSATHSSALVLWSGDRRLAHRFGWVLDGKLGHVMFGR